MNSVIDICIDRVALVSAGTEAATTGLLGYVSFRLNGAIGVDGVTLRRTLDDRHVLSFPARTDSSGQQHFFLRPLDNQAREAIERQVLDALGVVAQLDAGKGGTP